MENIMLKNAIRLLIGGYLYDTDISSDIDEMEKDLQKFYGNRGKYEQVKVQRYPQSWK